MAKNIFDKPSIFDRSRGKIYKLCDTQNLHSKTNSVLD